MHNQLHLDQSPYMEPGASPLLIEQLADDDKKARAFIHLLSLIDKTSDEERHFVINAAIEQAFAR